MRQQGRKIAKERAHAAMENPALRNGPLQLYTSCDQQRKLHERNGRGTHVLVQRAGNLHELLAAATS